LENSIVRRYGVALVDVFKKEGGIERLKETLEMFINIVKRNENFFNLLISPVISKKDKINILNTVVCKISSNKAFFNFLCLLILNNRFKYIYSIYSYILDIYYEENNISLAILLLVDKPEDPILEKLKTKIEKLIGRKVLFDVKIKKDILGGFIIILKDKIIDASIKRFLDEMVIKIKGEI
jgi:F-type H+-transporting ATPase subunit delta